MGTIIHILKVKYDIIIWNCIKKFLFHEENDTIIHKPVYTPFKCYIVVHRFRY